jgi:diguanylate cyclase (GGDEF)-like protein
MLSLNLKRSILTQLVLIISGASIVAALASTIGHYLLTVDIIEDSIEQQMGTALQLTSDYLEGNYSDVLRYDLTLLNSSREVDKFLGSTADEYLIHQQNIEKLFLSFSINRKKLYNSIRLIDESGNELAIIKNKRRFRDYNTVISSPPTPTNLMISELFLQLKNSSPGTVLFSRPAVEDGINYFSVGLAKTDIDIGGFGGAIIITFTLEEFTDYLNNFKVFDYSLVWLFTHSGQTIYQVHEDNAISPFPFLYDDKEKPSNISLYTSKRLAADSIQNIIQIAIILPPEAKKKLLADLVKVTILMLLTIASIGSIIAFLTAKRIVSPISHLTTLSHKVSTGDFNVRMPVTTTNEIGTLSQAFNIMVQELDEQHEELQSLANKDTLTQLPNRRQFEEHLNILVKSCNRNNTSIAVMYLDLDHFKDTNDSFGHPAGDKLIRYVAARLSNTVRESDLVARLGGDEFAVILNPHKTKEDTEHVAKKILSELSKPFKIEKHQIFSGASIGISVYPKHGKTSTELVKNADAAMYKAKNTGRNGYQFYSKDLTAKANDRVVLGALIRTALTNDEFTLHYQPKIDLTTKQVIGAEALLRWEHKGKMILPSKIINVAESSGFIEKIDAWVINKACTQIKQWEKNNIPILPVSINVSGRLLEDNKIVGLLKQALHEYSLNPKWIEIEITENDLISKHEQTKETLKVINGLGVKIAIDDFGTGYSSLSYLKDLLADTLKIDRKFVVNAMTNHADREIATAIVNLARALNMHVVVEGIETIEQETLFKDLGAHSAQGFLYAKAMTTDEYIHYIDTNNGLTTLANKPPTLS